MLEKNEKVEAVYPNMKILYENTDKPINQVWLTFPMPENNAVIRMITLTIGHESESNITYRIAAVDSPIRNLIKYLTADMPLVKLSELAEKIRDMGKEDCLKFSGVLDCRSVSGIEDVLQAAGSLEQYDFIPDVTSSRELGGYLVENGIFECPEHIWPYLDYSGIGEEYYANHDCVFTEDGLITRKDNCQTMEPGQSQIMQM